MPTSRRDMPERAAVRHIHDLVAALSEDLGVRISTVARTLQGLPYVDNPLGGGPGQTERLHLGLDAFDCVTYVESVYALARSADFAGFAEELTRIRYRAAQPRWEQRLHYFSDWLSANCQRRMLRSRSWGKGSILLRKQLACVAGLQPKHAAFWVVPPQALLHAAPRIAQGSVLAFASTRADLDFFHIKLTY